MSKILLLSSRKELVKRLSKILTAEGYKVSSESDPKQALETVSSKPYNLLIMDQNFSLPDGTPLVLFLALKIKTSAEPYPPVILIVPPDFQNHEYYPEVDTYISENTTDDEILTSVKTCLDSMQYLLTERHYNYESFNEARDFFDKELSSRDRELSSNTILLMKKNSQLYYIYTFLDKIKKNNLDESLDTLKKQLKNFLSEDDLMESFFTYFNKTHPGFLEKLDGIASLTLTEKKHCSCLKMGLDNKQVATLFSIDHGSVKKAQTRLKKKLQVDNDQSLREFILTL